MPHSTLRTSTRLSATALGLIALVTAGCADRATAPDARIPEQLNSRALADVAAETNDVSAAGAAANRGTITINLDMQPGSPTDVAFTAVGKKLPNFTLDDDADPALANSRDVEKLKPGTYTVQAPTSIGQYQLTSIVCSVAGTPGSNPNSLNLPIGTATIGLDPGEHVTCTYVMTVLAPI